MPIFNSTGEFMFLVLIAVLTLVLTNIGNNLVVVFTMLSVVTMMMNQGVAFNGQVAAIIITATGLLGFVLPDSFGGNDHIQNVHPLWYSGFDSLRCDVNCIFDSSRTTAVLKH